MDKNQHALFNYCLRLGDNSLILGQRITEWCSHAPILEEDIALANLALDLIGQAREFLTYAGEIEKKGRAEDDLAFLRDANEFRNALLVEQPNGDFAHTIVRQYLFSVFNYHLLTELGKGKDSTLAAIAVKSLKECTYHVRHSGEWILRMGDGTEESKRRLFNAFEDLWMYSAELFDTDESDDLLVKKGIAVDMKTIHPLWLETIKAHLDKISFPLPSNHYLVQGIKKGKHSEHLGHILAEMQFLPRAYPGTKW